MLVIVLALTIIIVIIGLTLWYSHTRSKNEPFRFDAAATTPMIPEVQKKLQQLIPKYSSIQRGNGHLSEEASNLYEQSKATILSFVGADPSLYLCIFTKNTTEAINKLSFMYDEQVGFKQANIVITVLEHHSNILPWRALAKRKPNVSIRIADMNPDGTLDINDLLSKVDNDTVLISVTGMSNVTGHKPNLSQIVSGAKRRNPHVAIHVDGAQLIPSTPVNVTQDGIDFISFSSHKMGSPLGVGVLIGKRNFLEHSTPVFQGGGEIEFVGPLPDDIVWKHGEDRHNEGTQNLLGIACLCESMKFLASNLPIIIKREKKIRDALLQFLSNRPDVIITSTADSSTIISFFCPGVNSNYIGKLLAEAGIENRSGCFCAMPYVSKLRKLSRNQIDNYLNAARAGKHLDMDGLVRLSLGYCCRDDNIDDCIKRIQKILDDLHVNSI